MFYISMSETVSFASLPLKCLKVFPQAKRESEMEILDNPQQKRTFVRSLNIIYEIDMLGHYLILFSSTMRPDDDDDDDDAGVWLM